VRNSPIIFKIFADVVVQVILHYMHLWEPFSTAVAKKSMKIF